MKSKLDKRIVRKNRIRAKVAGTEKRPRLSVFRSSTNIYAQLIDDENGKTLVSASSLGVKSKKDVAKEVGKSLAEKAVKKGISSVVFDRGGYIYTGNVKLLAEGAREGGLKF